VYPSQKRRRLTAVVAALALSVLIAQPTLAYTLLRNNFGSDPDNPGQPVGCTDVSPWWCVEWPLAANGYSSTTHIYLYSSLNNHPSGEAVDMKQQARNAFGRWNSVPAREPFLVEVTSLSQSSGNYNPYYCPTYIKRASLPTGYIAVTGIYTPYDVIGSGSKKLLTCSQMTVSSTLKFDANSDPGDGKIDARFMFTHELGHLLALGHTAHVAVMYPLWPNDVYMGINPTSDDILGLQVAYGAP
jgi:hypothetical protein